MHQNYINYPFPDIKYSLANEIRFSGDKMRRKIKRNYIERYTIEIVRINNHT